MNGQQAVPAYQPYRAYYEVHEQPELLVLVKGIAFNLHDRVYMGGEEIEL